MTVRTDKWLWSVRVYKTRSSANEACTSGKVRVNGEPAKPATKLKVGDHLEIRRKDRTLNLEVVQLLAKRVSATLAAEAMIDTSPPLPPRESKYRASEGYSAPEHGQRERGAGRPTKRDRRLIDKLRNRS